jgi:hypothetical protein
LVEFCKLAVAWVQTKGTVSTFTPFLQSEGSPNKL